MEAYIYNTRKGNYVPFIFIIYFIYKICIYAYLYFYLRLLTMQKFNNMFKVVKYITKAQKTERLSRIML